MNIIKLTMIVVELFWSLEYSMRTDHKKSSYAVVMCMHNLAWAAICADFITQMTKKGFIWTAPIVISFFFLFMYIKKAALWRLEYKLRLATEQNGGQ